MLNGHAAFAWPQNFNSATQSRNGVNANRRLGSGGGGGGRPGGALMKHVSIWLKLQW